MNSAHIVKPSRDGLYDYLFRHNNNTQRETQWMPLLFSGEITRRCKTVVVDEEGIEKVTDGECTITLSTLLDLNQPFQNFKYRVWQKRMKSENPILGVTKQKAVQRAWEARGVPFSWETSNMYNSSMMKKIPEYLEFCATGVEKDMPEIVTKPKKQKTASCANSNPEPSAESEQHVTNPRVYPDKFPEIHKYFKPQNTASITSATLHDETHTSDATETTKKKAPQDETCDLKPKVPSIDVQEARILYRNAALIKHLRTHQRGDWVKNPHRYISGKHVAEKTKERSASAIKSVIRDWLLTTPQGKRALAFADITEGELSIDRLIPRNDKSGTGLNCIYNLYMMPMRHNSYFGDQLTSEKCKYVGERAYKLAKGAHDAFVRDAEREYDWDDGYAKRAEFIVNAS